MADAILIHNEEAVSPIEVMKIKIAALLHDTGFMFTYQTTKKQSCVYANEKLRKYPISPEDMKPYMWDYHIN